MSASVPRLRVADVSLRYQPSVDVIGSVSFDLEPHEFVAVIGPSGCGKTSLLRIIAGLQASTIGTVQLDGAPVLGPEPRISMVFQHYGETLLPWKSVFENVVFGPTPPSAADRERAGELLSVMGLGDALRLLPWELSGGMQQRVALARALLRRPAVLLLDEPWSAVDERTRDALHELLMRVHREHPCSIVMVSHNLDHVLELTRRVIALSGRPARSREIPPAELTREGLRHALGTDR